GSLALGSSNRCGELLLKGGDDGDGAPGDVGTLVGEAELDGAGVAGVLGPLDQAGLFEGASELGDVDRLQAGPVGEFTLARLRPWGGGAGGGRGQGGIGGGRA